MSLNLVSPGVKVREVDLTIGRVDGANDQVGAIAGPFEKGPIDMPILIETEQDLLQTFGKPLSTDGQYGYWLSASNFLSYGGVLRVLRSDEAAGSHLNNANVGVNTTAGVTGVKIKSYENYVDDYQTVSNEALTWKYAAKNPGSWGNGLKVCTIDAFADQIITVTVPQGTAEAPVVGMGITQQINDRIDVGSGSTALYSGYMRGVVTGVTSTANGVNADYALSVKVTE